MQLKSFEPQFGREPLLQVPFDELLQAVGFAQLESVFVEREQAREFVQ